MHLPRARIGHPSDALHPNSRRLPSKRLSAARYAKTREVYAAYKKSRHKKEFRAAHAEEIAQHEAAKKAFDALGGKPIPKVAQLSKEYAALLAEKQAEYESYKALRQEMITIRTAKQNVDRILGLGPQGSEQKERQAR